MNQPACPSNEQWLTLLEYAKKYRNLKPYRKIVELKRAGGQKENPLILAVTPYEKETAYFTVMGGADLQDLGFQMYIGNKGFNEMLAFFEAQNPKSGLVNIAGEFHFYHMILCSKEELPWEYERLYRDLDVRFRGAGNSIYFRKDDGCYVTSLLTAEEAENMLEYFPPFMEVLQSYLNKKKKDPVYVVEAAHTYSRRQTEGGKWENTEEAFPLTKYEPEKPEYGNRDQKRFLKKQKHTGEIWEYDHYLLEDIVEDEEHKAPFFMRCALVLDHTNGQVIGQETPDPEEGPEFDSFFLANLIMEHGIPMKIRCADRIQKARLESLCQICGISLEINPSDIMQNLKEQISEACENSAFDELERVFRKAGVDTDQLMNIKEGQEDAALASINAQLERAVRSGKITQDELSEAIEAFIINMMYDEDDTDWEDEDDPDDDEDVNWDEEDWDDDEESDDDEDLDDDMDADWEDEEPDSEYYEEIPLLTMREKLTAVDIYYGKPVKERKQTIPVPPMNDYIPELDIEWETTAKLSETLRYVNQLLLKDMAEKLGGAVTPDRAEQDYMDIIIGFLRKKPADIQKILTKEELRLYRYLDKIRMPEHYNPFLEAEMENEQENLVGLVRKGLIDIGYYYADNGICLNLIVAHP